MQEKHCIRGYGVTLNWDFTLTPSSLNNNVLVSHYIYYEVKTPIVLLAKAGCRHGKALKSKEGKVIGDGILGLRAYVHLRRESIFNNSVRKHTHVTMEKQTVYAVWKNGGCALQEPYGSHKYTLWENVK